MKERKRVPFYETCISAKFIAPWINRTNDNRAAICSVYLCTTCILYWQLVITMFTVIINNRITRNVWIWLVPDSTGQFIPGFVNNSCAYQATTPWQGRGAMGAWEEIAPALNFFLSKSFANDENFFLKIQNFGAGNPPPYFDSSRERKFGGKWTFAPLEILLSVGEFQLPPPKKKLF